MINEKALDKIKKCLKLSKSSNVHEAAAALKQAQVLMKKYGINQEQLDFSNINVETCQAGKAKNPTRYHQMLVGLICDAFGVTAIYQSGHLFDPNTKVQFIGIESNPIIASYSYEVLFRQLKKDRTAYAKKSRCFKRANKTRKADLFAESWVQSVWATVQSFAQPKEHAELIERYKHSNHKNLGKTKDRKHKVRANDDGAMTAGYNAGSKVKLHQGVDGESIKRIGS